ncbi:IS3 family transposase, partial [Escherichia coli]|nr:IS3 family transposase [Escherichia coli]
MIFSPQHKTGDLMNKKTKRTAYFHERRSLNNFHRDRVITFEQIAE